MFRFDRIVYCGANVAEMDVLCEGPTMRNDWSGLFVMARPDIYLDAVGSITDDVGIGRRRRLSP